MAKNNNIRSVAHQGFSTTAQYYGNSRISSYVGAAQMGFDYGETDLKFTADNIPVCSHDKTFTDTHDGVTKVTIAECTLAELKTYGYCGETIATLDEVLFTCKTLGLGLYIDHLSPEWDDAKWETIFLLVKKYAMEDHVAWLTTHRPIIDRIQAWYKKSAINLVTGADDLMPLIELAKEIKNDWNEVSINANHAKLTVEQVIAYNRILPPGITLELWTVDKPELFEAFLPYLSAITSNKICANNFLK